MKNTLSFIFVIASYILINGQVNATDTANEEIADSKKMVKIQPLNPETEEIMKEIIAFNEVYKKAENSKRVVQNSNVLDDIEETMSNYISDLKNIIPQVEASQNENDRQKLLDQTYKNNNPFATFYL
jgi:hypothetical protein